MKEVMFLEIKLNKVKIKKNCRLKINFCVIVVLLSFVFFVDNVGFSANAISRVGKVKKSTTVVTKSKKNKSNSKNKKTEVKDLVDDKDARIRELEQRVSELEERLKKLEDKQKMPAQEINKKEKDGNAGEKYKNKKNDNSDWTWPVPGYHHITSGFSDTEGRNHVHGAIDIGGDSKNGSIYGASIVAAHSGTVILACTNGYGGGYGNYVVIDHGNKESTLYGHLSSVSVSKGQKVSKGEKIGKAGSTGFSTGPHLHFEYRVNGVRTNPLKVLNY